jgi:hypothetical protein
MRVALIKKLALKQQAFFNYANSKLDSIPMSVVWLLLRFVYRLMFNCYSILISLLEQSNTAWIVNAVVFVTLTLVIVILQLNYLLIILLASALYFLGEYVSKKMSPSTFVFLFSVFLATCFINFLPRIAKFSPSFLVMLFVMLVLINIGFAVIIGKIINFVRSFAYYVKKTAH